MIFLDQLKLHSEMLFNVSQDTHFNSQLQHFFNGERNIIRGRSSTSPELDIILICVSIVLIPRRDLNVPFCRPPTQHTHTHCFFLMREQNRWVFSKACLLQFIWKVYKYRFVYNAILMLRSLPCKGPTFKGRRGCFLGHQMQ